MGEPFQELSDHQKVLDTIERVTISTETRAALHPIDAESDIEERSKNVSQPCHPDLSDCRRHIALGH
jgi:hypothetical protein